MRASMRDVIANTQRTRSFAAALALLCVPSAAIAGGYERTFTVGANTVELGLRYDDSNPSAVVRTWEGSLKTALHLAGQLTLSVPALVGEEGAALGSARVGADFGLLEEHALLPKFDLAARVDLPTARGTRDALTGVKAIATKHLGLGVLDSIHVESELWTDTGTLLPSYRTAVRTLLKLEPETTGSLELITLPHEGVAQLGLSHKLGEDTGLSAGVAAHFPSGARTTSSVQATFGFHTRF